MNEQHGFRDKGFANLVSFPVVVSGGVGKFTFPVALSGKIYHRQITPTASGNGSLVFYVQNSLAIAHDYHTTAGFSGTAAQDFDDEALWVNETTFNIANASTDDTYTVTIWLNSQ